MKNLFISASIVACMFIYTPLVYADAGYSSLVRRIRPSIVTIYVYNYDGSPKALGSGFFYNSRGDILTNSHVLTPNSRAEIRTVSGKKYPVGSVIERDEKKDIVKAKTLAPKETPFLKPAAIPPVSGDSIMVIGSPMGLEQTVSEGIVSAWRDIPGKGTVVQISAPVSPGSSGAPVLNIKGEVIGIATFQMLKGQNLNFAVPIKDLIAASPSAGQKTRKLTIRKDKSGIIIIE